MQETKNKKKRSQVTIFFMLLLTLLMMFVVVMMDVNKVAMNKLVLDISVDNAALSFGSMLASEARVLSATRMAGGAHRTVMLSDQGVVTVILGVILVIIAIIIAIATEGGGAPLVVLAIAALTGAIVAMGVWLVGEYVRQAGVINQWTETISTFPNKNARYRENLISMLLPVMATDQEMVRDIHDFNQNSRVSDELSRFMFLYSHRLNKLIQSDSASQTKLAYNCGRPMGRDQTTTENIPKALLKVTESLEALSTEDNNLSYPLTASDVYYDTNRTANPRVVKGALDLTVMRDMLANGVQGHYVDEDLYMENYDLNMAAMLPEMRRDLCGGTAINGSTPCEDVWNMTVTESPYSVSLSCSDNGTSRYCGDVAINQYEWNANLKESIQNSLVCRYVRLGESEPPVSEVVSHASWARQYDDLAKRVEENYTTVQNAVDGKKISLDMVLEEDTFFKKGLMPLYESLYSTSTSRFMPDPTEDDNEFISYMGAAYKLIYYMYDNRRMFGNFSLQQIELFKKLDRWFSSDLAFMRQEHYRDWTTHVLFVATWSRWPYVCTEYEIDKVIYSDLNDELAARPNPSKLDMLTSTVYAELFSRKLGQTITAQDRDTFYRSQVGRPDVLVQARVDQGFINLWVTLFGAQPQAGDNVTPMGLLDKFVAMLVLKPYPSTRYPYRDVYRDYGETGNAFDISTFAKPLTLDYYGYCDHQTDACTDPSDDTDASNDDTTPKKINSIKKLRPISDINKRFDYVDQRTPYRYFALNNLSNYQILPYSAANEAAYHNGQLKRLLLWSSAHDNAARPDYEACAATPVSSECEALYTEEGDIDELKGDEVYAEERVRFGKELVALVNSASVSSPKEGSVLSDMFDVVRRIRKYVDEVTFKGPPVAAKYFDDWNNEEPDDDDWETVQLEPNEINDICNGKACNDPDEMVFNKYFLMPLTTPRKSMRILAGTNGMLQNYFEVENYTQNGFVDPAVTSDPDLLPIPNTYKMEMVMNQFNKNPQQFENLVPIQEDKYQDMIPGDPKIRVLKSNSAATPADKENYYGNPYSFNFYTPPYVSGLDFMPEEIRHNPNNLQLVRKLWVMENLLVNVVWEDIVNIQDRIETFKRDLQSIRIDAADTEMIELRSRLIEQKINKPLRYIEQIKTQIVRFCYIDLNNLVSGTASISDKLAGLNPVLDSANVQEIIDYNDNVVHVWDEDSFSSTKPVPSLYTIRRDIEDSMEALTKVRGMEGGYMSDAGEAIYAWRDAIDDGGKWHLAYVFSQEDLPYPYVEARSDTKLTYTLGYSWMRPYCNPEFDCVGTNDDYENDPNKTKDTVFNITQCDGSGDAIQGIKDDDNKNWNCENPQSAWIKAARFDEPDMFLGWPMFSSLKETKRWRLLKKDLMEYIQAKAEQIYLNEIAGLGPDYFDVDVALWEENQDGELIPKPSDEEIALMEKRKKEMRESLAGGQILFTSSDSNIFVPLRSFLVNNGVWSRAKVTIEPEVVEEGEQSASGASWEDIIAGFWTMIGSKTEWVHEIVDWRINITDTGSDCGYDDDDRCNPEATTNQGLLDKFNDIKKALNSVN